MFARTTNPLPIGLDLGHDSVKLVQLIRAGQQHKVFAAARELIDDEGVAAADRRQQSLALARRLLASQNFKGRKVVACLPRELIHLKNIRLPVMPLAEVGQAVAFEAANAFSFDLSNAVVKHVVAGEIRHGSETRLEVMCLAVLKAEIDEFIEQVHHAGLELAGLEFEAASLFSGLNSFLAPAIANSATLLLDVGYRRSQVIIGRGNGVQFFKPIDIGSRRLISSVARKLGITEKEASALRHQLDSVDAKSTVDESVSNAVEDATRQTMTELAREVALCLRYFSVTFRGVRVKEMRISGGEANCTLLRRLLQSELPVAVQEWPQLPYANAGSDPMSIAPWGLAVALAARSLRDEPTISPSTTEETWTPPAAVAEVIHG